MSVEGEDKKIYPDLKANDGKILNIISCSSQFKKLKNTPEKGLSSTNTYLNSTHSGN